MNAQPQTLPTRPNSTFPRNSVRLLAIVIVATLTGFVLMLGTAQLPSPSFGSDAPGPPAAALQGPVCGNGICETEQGEGVWNCSQDCSWCGDNVCRPEEVDSCCGAGNDCTVAITCGDGVCSACESNANCPGDCDVAGVTPNTAPPSTDPPSVTTTQPPVVETAADVATDEAGDTATPADEAASESPGETSTPAETPDEAATPNDGAAPELDAMGNCRIVNEDVISDALEIAADANAPTGIEGLIASLSGGGRRFWVVCNEPPETVCLPARDLEGLSGVSWLDCTSAGPACTETTQMDLVSGEVCVNNTGGRLLITCAEGCTLRMDEDVALEDYILPAVIVLLLVALIIMLILLAMSRRRREDEGEDDGGDDDYGPETIAM